MAEDLGAPDEPGTWRGGWAGIAAVLAALLLIALLATATIANRARDQAVEWERHAYDIMLLTRSVDASMARSEAALGRYVLDEDQRTGTLYYNEWRLAARQIGQLHRLVQHEPDQAERVRELRDLFDRRGKELAGAAAIARSRQGSGGVPAFYQAGRSATGPALRAKLEAIAANERDDLRARMAETRLFSARADRVTDWLGWLSMLIAIGAVVLALVAYRAFRERLVALQEADTEASRAKALEEAVQERTRELSEANARLRAEAAERAAAEEQLRQVQKMEAVGQLTGGIAHDFNNMLAVVVGGLDLARRKLRGNKREAELHLDNAMEGATRAAALTRRLLAFARAEPLLPADVAPGELVEGMLDLIDRSIGERITVSTRFAPGSWHVFVDPHQLENAILNLAVNARDAMENGGELTIAIENATLGRGQSAQLAEGEYVRISVSDTGSGIPPEMLERVFEPFFTTKPVGKGTGLGLSQIFGFARQSGGDVTIDSRLGVGTTVSIYLPRSRRVADTAQERMHPPRATRPEQAEQGAGAAVLVVEDDPRVCRATVGALEELGHHPVACTNGRAALQILERNRGIELLITDVMMPEMTGPELVREATALYPDMAVLFVTGYVGEAGDAEDLAGYHLLRKPFTVAALADAVSAALGREVSESPPASTAAAAG